MSKTCVYLANLQKSSKEVEDEQLEFQVEEAEQDLKSSELATKKTISRLQREIKALKNEFPLNVSSIASKVGELEEAQLGLKLLRDLAEELFSSTKK